MPTRKPLPVYRSALKCTVAHCHEKRVQGSASNYCQRHRTGNKQHGDPLQVPLRIPQVRKVETEVRKIYKRLSPARRAELPDRAARYCKPFHEFLQSCAEGSSEFGNNRFAVESGARLLRVFDEVDPLSILTRASALYLMREQMPHVFRNERAFRFQLVRAVRKLTSVADGSYWNNRNQRKQQIVNEIPMRVRENMAEYLVEFFTPWVTQVANIAEKQARTEAARSRIASETFSELREKVRVEHAKAERRLAIAQRLKGAVASAA